MSNSKSATIPSKRITDYKGPGKVRNYSPIKESNEGGTNSKTGSKFSSTSKKIKSDEVTEESSVAETDPEEEKEHQA